jgi:hypothetical protein
LTKAAAFGITTASSGTIMATGFPRSTAAHASSVSTSPAAATPCSTYSRTMALPESTRTPLARRPAANRSPSAPREAACALMVPKRGSEIATLPFQRGSRRSVKRRGRSAAGTSPVFTRITRAREENAVHPPGQAGNPSASGDR